MKTLVQLLFLINLARVISSARILGIYPTPSISHQVVFRPLMQELAKRGHEVTVITTDPAFTDENRPANLTEIDVHDISYKMWQEAFVFHVEFGKKSSIFPQVKAMLNLLPTLIEAQLKTKEVQQLINDPKVKFDLLFIEAWVQPALVYTHIFKAPTILISSFGIMSGNHEIFGIPFHPLLYPLFVNQRVYNLTFTDKVSEMYKLLYFEIPYRLNQNNQIVQFRKFLGDDLPHYYELNKNVDMFFVNYHELWMSNQPLTPNVISIWGIYRNPVKPLPKDLKNFLDSSKNGVIYISFGSNARSTYMPKEFIELLLRVFSKLPYDVLWKWESDVLPGKSDNIRTEKWLPQSDLLRHPKIKLFITQGGLQSTDETILAGVPVIGIPLLADQWYNVEKYEYHGIGIKLLFDTITDEKLEAAIHTVINDESYRKNVERLRVLMNDQPIGALDRAVWWTEYVLRHGGAKHLHSPAANMSLAEYYEVKFILQLLSIFLLAIAAILVPVYWLFKQLKFSAKVKTS